MNFIELEEILSVRKTPLIYINPQLYIKSDAYYMLKRSF